MIINAETGKSEDGFVSAIIPTRDRPDLLRRAIRSVLDQRGGHLLEVIVVFDQEEPDKDLHAEFPDAPLRLVVNNRTPGLAGARNSGIDVALGEWVAFCDDDDAWSRDRLQRQLALANRLPHVDFVVAGIEIRRGNRSFVRVPNRSWITFPDLLRSRIMEAHPSTFLVRRLAIDEIGEVDEKLPGSYAEDYDWLLRGRPAQGHRRGRCPPRHGPVAHPVVLHQPVGDHQRRPGPSGRPRRPSSSSTRRAWPGSRASVRSPWRRWGSGPRRWS